LQLSTGLTFTGGFALAAPASVLADYLAVAGGGEAFKIHSAEKPRINVVNEVYTQREMTDKEKEILWNEMQNRKPYDSWLLNKYSCIWEPPVEHPKDGKKYLWNEETLSWLEINQ
jgi:hypothetical protein